MVFIITILSLLFCRVFSHLNKEYRSEIDVNDVPNIPFGQLQALHTLYDATNGEHWNWTRVGDTIPWNFSTPHPNPCVAKWQGITCNTQCFTGTKNSYCQVIELDLDRHNLNGTLPDSLEFWGNLTTLTYLSLAYNTHIVGTIPHGLGKLSNLETLYLNNIMEFSFSPVPDIFYSMPNLQLLDLAISYRNGTLPRSFYSLKKLIYVDLGDNYFVGTISDAICTMSSMTYLFFPINIFTGTLPNCWDELTMLNTLELTHNFLSGTVPPSIFSIEGLQALYLDANFLHGNISDRISQQVNLLSIDVYDNCLTGTFPKLNNAKGLQVLSTAINYFSGPLPVHLNQSLTVLLTYYNQFTGSIDQCNFTNMITFDIFSNYLTGSLPHQINDSRTLLTQNIIDRINVIAPIAVIPGVAINYLSFDKIANSSGSKLFYLSIHDNFFSGTLPQWTADSPFLVYFYGNDNFFTGSIPTGKNGSALAVLYLDNNQLTGTIPESIVKNHGFVNLRFPNNMLTGTISSDILKNNRDMKEFAANGNQFTGPIPIPPDTRLFESELEQISLSNNQLTGTIPWDYFSIPKLATFAVSENCLSGSLSDQICNAELLQSLILDGISSASNCQLRIFPDEFHTLTAFRLKNVIKGSIPSCVFEMPFLRNLYLSGNGLVGTIPANINISSAMESLRLSYNRLSGSIPSAIQSRSWSILDLSYNKFKGDISSSMDTSFPNISRKDHTYDSQQKAAIYLDVNRLSGNIPPSLKALDQISILNGNIFYCSLNRKELPVNDPKAVSYNCGSENIEHIGIVIAGVIFILSILLLYCWCFIKDFIDTWCRAFINNLKLWNATIKEDISLAMTPSVDILKLGFGLNILKHVQKVSFWFAVAQLVVLMPLYRIVNIFNSMFQQKYGWEFSAIYMYGYGPGLLLIIIFTITIVIMFYYLKFFWLQHSPKQQQSIVAKNSIQAVKNSIEKKPSQPQTSGTHRLLYTTLVLMVNVISMIAVNSCYIVVVVYVNDNASIIVTQIGLALIKVFWNDIVVWKLLSYFKTLTRHDGKVVTPYDVSLTVSCLLFNNIIAPCLSTMVVSPTCFYNALVAIKKITAYFVYCSFYVKLGRKGAVCVSHDPGETSFTPPFLYSYNCASLLPVNYAAVYVYMAVVIGTLLPILKVFIKIRYDMILKADQPVSNALFNVTILKKVDHLVPLACKPLQPTPPQPDVEDGDIKVTTTANNQSLFYRDRYVVRVIGLFAILISFGVIFPPVGVAVAWAIIQITLYEELTVGRLLYESRKLGYKWYRERLELDMQGMAKALSAAVFPTTMTAGLLFGALVFDTIGDQEGFQVGLSTGISMSVLPVLVLLCYNQIVKRWYRQRKNVNDDDDDSEGIQMSCYIENPIYENGIIKSTDILSK